MKISFFNYLSITFGNRILHGTQSTTETVAQRPDTGAHASIQWHIDPFDKHRRTIT
jgi:hypothetical protein